jgi:hypothetical protein
MQSLPLPETMRDAPPPRQIAQAAPDARGDRFVPAATWLAAIATLLLIFFGRW